MTTKVWRRRASPASALLGVHPLLARLYAARGVQSSDELAQTLAALKPASALQGLEAALDLLQHALREQWRLLIIGDFDADGATSTALSVRALRALGAVSYTHLTLPTICSV